jgi:hypothetical protein
MSRRGFVRLGETRFAAAITSGSPLLASAQPTIPRRWLAPRECDLRFGGRFWCREAGRERSAEGTMTSSSLVIFAIPLGDRGDGGGALGAPHLPGT